MSSVVIDNKTDWTLQQTVEAAGTYTKTFLTQNTFVDRNIKVDTVVPAASFGRQAQSGKTYTDISDSEASPVLSSGDYLYVNKGFVDDVKISLAKLIPDAADIQGHSEYLLNGHKAYDIDGNLISGSMPTFNNTYAVT